MIHIAGAGDKGRGVFAGKSFVAGERIERLPVIVIPHAQVQFLEKTALANYVFSWGVDDKDVAMPCGFGSFYNHSYEPNAKFVKLLDTGFIDVVAIRAICEKEEITFNYNGTPNDSTPVWFDGEHWGWHS
jgi:SET domain-containing protein